MLTDIHQLHTHHTLASHWHVQAGKQCTGIAIAIQLSMRPRALYLQLCMKLLPA